jgi:hypothetical protein
VQVREVSYFVGSWCTIRAADGNGIKMVSTVSKSVKPLCASIPVLIVCCLHGNVGVSAVSLLL